jgi:hypothetical protein
MDGLPGESVDVPALSFTGSEASLSVWFRLNTLRDGNVLFSGRSTTDSNVYALLSIDHDGRAQFQFRTDPTANDRKAQGMGTLNKNEWYNLIFTASGATYKMYINGEEVMIAGDNIGRWFSDLTNQTLSYHIASSDANPLVGSLDGTIDELRIFNRVLTQSDVTELYHEGNVGQPSVPLALIPSLDFSISTDSILPKGEVTLTWNALRVESCSASGDWSGTVPLSGVRTQTAITNDSTYTISCNGKGGSVSHSVMVRVGTTTPAAAGTLTVTTTPTASSKTPFLKNLSQGSRGGDVVRLQSILVREGFLSQGLASGYFGALTKSALVKFQMKHGVAGTGYCGPLTRALLGSL